MHEIWEPGDPWYENPRFAWIGWAIVGLGLGGLMILALNVA